MGNSPTKDGDKPVEPSPPKEPGMFAQITMGYDQLVNAIIRPPRAEYDIRNLGPREFTFAGRLYVRTDFDLDNGRGMNLKCSHWEPVDRPIEQLPCVLYLHGNSSCRVEATNVLSPLLSGGMTVLAFDFAGSGQSDGEYVSLGYYEKDDLAAVVGYLRETGRVSTLGLWGRSMGAATALQHGDRDPSIAGMVIDSGFTSLEVLSRELVDMARNQGHTIPGFAVSIAMSMIKSSVKKKAKFKMEQLTPIAHVDKCFIPAKFIHGRGDEFILPHHSEEMHKHYAGDKDLILVDGDHNSPRPPHVLDTAAIFLHNTLLVDPRCCPDLEGNYAVNPGRSPWQQQHSGANSMEFEDFLMSRPTFVDEMNGSNPAGGGRPTNESVAANVQRMAEMGFPEDIAREALLENHDNVDLAIAAITELMESPVAANEPEPIAEVDTPAPFVPPAPLPQTSLPPAPLPQAPMPPPYEPQAEP